MKKIRILLVLPTVLVAGACSDDATSSQALPLLPAAEAASRGATQPAAAASSPTLVDLALAANAETGEFSTLIAAVLAADLAGELSARGQRTVFAPTDAAFAAIELTPDNIGAVPVEDLREILLYHVAPGRRNASAATSSDRIRMANGGWTTVRVTDEGAFINDAAIVATDLEATNGIIHVIAGVLLP
jgi:uncharacterized surface protein with fasciclin (FAS1) repeats